MGGEHGTHHTPHGDPEAVGLQEGGGGGGGGVLDGQEYESQEGRPSLV